MKRRKIPTGYENDEKGMGVPRGSVHRSGLSRELDFCQVVAEWVVVNKRGGGYEGEGALLKGRTCFSPLFLFPHYYFHPSCWLLF